MTERLLTTRRVAELLGFCPATVLRKWRAGELPGYRLASHVLRFRESDVEAWLSGLRVATSEPELNGRPGARRDLTLQELAHVFLERHQAVASKRTVQTLKGPPRAAPGRLRRRSPGRPRADDGRDRRVRLTAPGAIQVRGRVGVAAEVRGGRPLRIHDAEPGEARREEPPAGPSRGAGLHSSSLPWVRALSVARSTAD